MTDVDPNVTRISELKTKVEGGQELTQDDEKFLDQMAADPNSGVEVVEEDVEGEEIDYSE